MSNVIISLVDGPVNHPYTRIPSSSIIYYKNHHTKPIWATFASRTIAMFRYFLQHTDAEWIFRCMDDSLISPEHLPGFIKMLNEKYDGYNEAIVKGALISADGLCYIQGGSGILFSRAAIRRMQPHFEKWIHSLKWRPEDLYYINLAQMAGVSMESLDSEYFLGHGIAGELSFVSLPVCEQIDKNPKILKKNSCQKYGEHFVKQANKIVFYHDGHDSYNDNLTMGHSRFRRIIHGPDYLHFFTFDENREHVCIKQEDVDKYPNVTIIKDLSDYENWTELKKKLQIQDLDPNTVMKEDIFHNK